jgi:hypothetical protein
MGRKKSGFTVTIIKGPLFEQRKEQAYQLLYKIIKNELSMELVSKEHYNNEKDTEITQNETEDRTWKEQMHHIHQKI